MAPAVAPASTAALCQPSAALSLRAPIALSADSAYEPIATGLTAPRHLLVDDYANVLVVDSGRGVVALTESASCGGWEQRLVVNDTTLNTGIALAGSTLYASSTDALFAYDYDAATIAVTSSAPRTLVAGMGGSSHNTRTIVLEPGTTTPSWVIMGRGSDGNLDTAAQANNRAQIRRFPLNATSTLTWTDGELLASGIRNAVGMAVAPDNEQLYIVENSADNLATTTGIDVHQGNPAEEVNVVNLTAPGGVYGYPTCFTVFEGDLFSPSKATGSQFSIDAATSDDACQTSVTPPRLGLPAHYAPLECVVLHLGGDRTLSAKTPAASSSSRRPQHLQTRLLAPRGPTTPSSRRTAAGTRRRRSATRSCESPSTAGTAPPGSRSPPPTPRRASRPSSRRPT